MGEIFLHLEKCVISDQNVCFSSHSWDIEGAAYGIKCGEIESGAALVFEKEGRRRVCTPYIDTTTYGNLRFHFTMGILPTT